VSRKEKASNNKDKARKKYAKLARHVANKRLDFCHKLSRYYASNYDVIVLEDLNMQEMSQTLHLGKSVNDLGFGQFKEMLSYKCEECDSVLMYADKWFPSSKKCHECGSKNDLLKLNDRQWVCPNCGRVIDRDLNAALNLRDYFYAVVGIDQNNTDGTSEIHASGEVASTLRETVKQVASLKEESPSFRWG
jgi:putative transposase